MTDERSELKSALATLWTLGIIGICLLPASELPSENPLPGLDKAVHVVMFAGFGLLWLQALTAPPARRAAVVLGAGLALATLTELTQHLLPLERTFSLLDLLADLIGVGGVLLVYWYKLGEER